MKNWWRQHKQAVLGSALIMSLFLVIPNTVLAAPNDTLVGFQNILANLVLWVAGVIGKLIALMLSVLQLVLQYNNFIRHPVVEKGWEITRDLVNTGFVVMMLVIAFGTMFGVSKVNWQRNIPKLFIAAIAVNFSRLITGIFIDIGQVIMIAFVNALQQVGFANFVDLFKLRESQALSATGLVLDVGVQFGAAVFALVTVLVTLIVIGIMVAVLVYRIVILWVLIILSPVAFFAGAAQDIFSKAGQVYSEWWSKLTAAVMIGPVLSFFLWLALASVSEGLSIGQPGQAETTFIGTELGSTDQFTGFIIAIALMMAGLEAAMQSANQLGGVASKAVSGGTALAKRVVAAPTQVAARVGIGATRKGLGAVAGVVQPNLQWRAEQFRNYRENAPGFRDGLSRAERRDRREQLAQEMAAEGGWTGAKGRARLAKVQAEKAAMRDRDSNIAKGIDGLDDDQSTKSALNEIDRLNNLKDSQQTASDQLRAGKLAHGIISDQERFAKLQAVDPKRAAAELKRAKKYAKRIGDEGTQQKIDDMLERNIAWAGLGVEGMTQRLSEMTDAEKRKLSQANWSDADFREAARNAGFTDQLNDPERNKGFSQAMVNAAALSRTNAGMDEQEQVRYKNEKNEIAELRRSNGNKTEVERREKSNEALHQLRNAAITGSMGTLLGSEQFKLQDIEVDNLGEETRAALQSALVDVVTDTNAGDTLQSLKDASQGVNANASERTRAQGIVGLMGNATFGAQVDQRVNENLAQRSTERRNNVILTGDMGRYGYRDGAFDGPKSRGEFKAAVVKDPTVVLNIEEQIKENNGDNQVVEAIGDMLDEKTIAGLHETAMSKAGTPKEDIYRRALDAHADILEKRIKQLETSGADANKEILEQAQKAQRYYNRRIKNNY